MKASKKGKISSQASTALNAHTPTYVGDRERTCGTPSAVVSLFHQHATAKSWLSTGGEDECSY